MKTAEKKATYAFDAAIEAAVIGASAANDADREAISGLVLAHRAALLAAVRSLADERDAALARAAELSASLDAQHSVRQSYEDRWTNEKARAEAAESRASAAEERAEQATRERDEARRYHADATRQVIALAAAEASAHALRGRVEGMARRYREGRGEWGGTGIAGELRELLDDEPCAASAPGAVAPTRESDAGGDAADRVDPEEILP